MYKGVRRIFSLYWRAYGGWYALARSPYLHISLVLTILMFYTWSSSAWWKTVTSVLPNVLGFTLAGLAVFTAFGDERFRQLLAEPDLDEPDKPVIYVQLCASFVHFIVVQLVALITALLVESWQFSAPWPDFVFSILPFANKIGGFFGWLFFVYGLLSALAATMYLLRVVNMFATTRKISSSPINPPAHR